MIMVWLIFLPALLYSAVILFLKNGLMKLKTPGEKGGHNFSVVIAARNEEKNIARCLSSVLNQNVDTDRFEVIVVNDRSTDNTGAIVKNLTQMYHNVKLVEVKETPPGLSPKKYAVQKGVEVADKEIIVFTDADCVVPSGWLDTIDRYFSENTGLVQGITCYSSDPLMNKTFFGLQAIDFLSHGVVAAAAIGAGVPINSNANNFAFRRTAFLSCGYGDKACGVVSGDDDLLLQRIWKSRKWVVSFMADPRGAVKTKATPTLKEVFEQRKRWGSKTVHYCAPQVILLSSVFLFYGAAFMSLILSLFDRAYFPVALSMLGLKITGEAILLVPGIRIFRKDELRRYILPASLIQLPLVLTAVFSGVFGRFDWKDQKFSRKVK
ncbi:Glycosyl transferase, family 2 [Chitinispirillum alkaliphilum]|nr:Glycosyl transferase, family 2 [Chitinispirillum alkaliphilum]